uniref:Uncharacterized protein n=1 Tax=Glossina palpalis gambiensis TaxID=67801 RepID=A0A1B0BCE0_9MUSC
MHRIIENIKSRSSCPMIKSVSSPELSQLRSPAHSILPEPNTKIDAQTDINPLCPYQSLQFSEDFPDSQDSNADPLSVQSLDEISSNYYRKSYSNYNLLTYDKSKIYWHMNQMFNKRLRDIDNNEQNSLELKLVAYQEWLDILLQIYDSAITHIEELETKMAERLDYLRHNNYNSLVKVVYYNDNWDFRGLSLETISGVTDPSRETLRIDNGETEREKEPADIEIEQKYKLQGKLKALAVEIAEKHDEIQMLRKQLTSKEREMKEKLQHRDKIIKELRKDLKGCLVHVSKSDVHAFFLQILKFLSGKF